MGASRNRAFIRISAQAGEDVETQTVLPLIADFNSALDKYTSSPYSKEISSFYTTFRIDGRSKIACHESGVKRLKLQKKRGYVSADVCFKWNEHHQADTIALKGLIFEREAAAIAACRSRIEREGISFDFEAFDRDVAAALEDVWKKWFAAAQE